MTTSGRKLGRRDHQLRKELSAAKALIVQLEERAADDRDAIEWLCQQRDELLEDLARARREIFRPTTASRLKIISPWEMP